MPRASQAKSSNSPERRRRAAGRTVLLDRALEALPLFRLSDSAEDTAIDYVGERGGRWRVLPAPGERLPGTFDQDVYVELCRRYAETRPADGALTFTLHAFLRAMGRRVDGRTYEQLRAALTRLQRTSLESHGAYLDANGAPVEATFTILSTVAIDRRRATDRDQFALFDALTNNEPGDARVVLHPLIRGHLSSGHTIALSAAQWGRLTSPVARRLYRLLETERAAGRREWRPSLERLAAVLPLTQRYPSHLQRVLQPAHEMLLTSGIAAVAGFEQSGRQWHAHYVLAPATL
ncbi:MAG: replication initiator protein A [Gemmatimonadaceae bacterium]|nr:replication initiator protein A [Gemmatimonadaceae bacterium]